MCISDHFVFVPHIQYLKFYDTKFMNEMNGVYFKDFENIVTRKKSKN